MTGLGQTITDALIEQLRDEIRSGAIPPGTRLRQVEVAGRFNVSTTPVREAFTALEREGLLVSEPHRGVIVFRPTVEDLRETYEIRIALEALATRVAVERMTDRDVADLGKILERMHGAKASIERYGALNDEFHARIYTVAGMPKLQKLIGDLRAASEVYLRVYATIRPTADRTHPDHVAIFEACRARDAKGAARAMEAHLQHTVDLVSSGLDGS